MVEINKIKAQLVKTFQMKDLAAVKQILGIKVYRDKKNGELLLQHDSMENKLMRFIMNIVKLVNAPLAFHCNFS